MAQGPAYGAITAPRGGYTVNKRAKEEALAKVLEKKRKREEKENLKKMKQNEEIGLPAPAN